MANAVNYVTTPRFTSDSGVGDWEHDTTGVIIGTNVSEREGAGIGPGMSWRLLDGKARALMIPLPLTWQDGDSYDIRLWGLYSPAAEIVIGLVPQYVDPVALELMRHYNVHGVIARHDVPQGYTSWSGTFTLSNGDVPMQNRQGNDLPAGPAGEDLKLMIYCGVANGAAISHAVVTDADTGPDGYWDGTGRSPTDDGTHPGDGNWTWAWQGSPFQSVSIAASEAQTTPPDIVDPGPQTATVGELYSQRVTATGDPATWSAVGLPDGITISTDGLIEGTPTAAGTFIATVTATNDGGSDTVNIDYTVDAAEPDPPDPPDDGDPWDAFATLADKLAPRVAAYVGAPDDPTMILTARGQLPVVAEYVNGYTRGRGWTGDVPARPLLAVIVSATARLVTNPEQVSYYVANDYSERPAVLAGWTLTERAVLHRYRRVTA